MVVETGPQEAMSARLYLMPGPSPSMTTRLVCAHKGVEFDRVDLVAGVHKSGLRLLGFEGGTVPARTLDGRRIRGLRRIARELDRLVADPSLFPSDPARRARVEEAERWAHEQPGARRIALSIMRKARPAVRQTGLAARLLMPCDDLRVDIEGRPAGVLALRDAPHYPVPAGRMLPLEWLRWTTT
jgi:glutathione S-transferase